MLKEREQKTRKSFTVLMFQICVIANSILGSDEQLFVISKAVMLLFFGVMTLDVILQGGKLVLGRNIIWPVLFIGYSVVSILWSYNVNAAFAQLKTQLQLFLLLLFTYLVMINGATIKDYLDAIYCAGIGMIVFAMIRYGGFENYLDVMESGDRMGDAITNENTFGLIFANAALSATYYLIVKKKKWHILSILLFAFFALSSGSKKATALIIVGILGICVVHFGIKKIYKTVLIGAVILVAAWYVLQLPIFSTINARLESYFSGELNQSDRNRQEMIRLGMEYFKQRPLFGFGLSSFAVLDHSYRGTYSHNNFVEVLVSLGVVGFVLYYMMYISPLSKMFLGKYRKIVWKNRQYLMLLLWVSIDLVFGYGMVQIYGKTSFILIGVALAAADKIHRESEKQAIDTV